MALTERLGLARHVTMLGSRTDIQSILAGSDIGVLSSTSEGLPVSLLEYGVAGLPAVASDAGQCREVLDGGDAGILFSPGDVAALADALIGLLQAPDRRSALGRGFRERVARHYSPEAVIQQICSVYEKVLAN
jgi:glycosyltransferase involved in cell wall biosynthesis